MEQRVHLWWTWAITAFSVAPLQPEGPYIWDMIEASVQLNICIIQIINPRVSYCMAQFEPIPVQLSVCRPWWVLSQALSCLLSQAWQMLDPSLTVQIHLQDQGPHIPQSPSQHGGTGRARCNDCAEIEAKFRHVFTGERGDSALCPLTAAWLLAQGNIVSCMHDQGLSCSMT